MDLVEIMNSSGIVAVVTGTMTILSGWLFARLQRSHNKEVERDRFRHDIAAEAARVRLDVHVSLANKVATAYRGVKNKEPKASDQTNDAKNYYYDHRFFFSHELGNAFRSIAGSLAADYPKKEILEANLNSFFTCVRNDLLLTELSDSAGRAVKT